MFLINDQHIANCFYWANYVKDKLLRQIEEIDRLNAEFKQLKISPSRWRNEDIIVAHLIIFVIVEFPDEKVTSGMIMLLRPHFPFFSI
ncbi:hypothetical protein RCL_jg28659.t1 [Rhizophagus clarus]|uniref:Uncharacterized protein n=1 Tax=Rhizophagus clarus TaxID=94130 RepID=A0A8H3QTM6_9GLOM|nr:hypothetical protein RCL_jg28659.t1 [Rhizophagus clarus]